jgi:hypothetical protein
MKDAYDTIIAVTLFILASAIAAITASMLAEKALPTFIGLSLLGTSMVLLLLGGTLVGKRT